MKYTIFVTLILFVHSCHYTCSNCTAQTYLNCTSCNHGNFKLLYDSAAYTTQFFPNHILSGVCIQNNQNVNAFGILTLVGVITAFLLTLKRQNLVLLSSLQDLSFLSLIQISLLNPLKYVINGLQYTLFFTTVSKNIKEENSDLLKQYLYKLQIFLGTNDLVQNGKVLDAVLAIVLFISFVIPIISQIRDLCVNDEQRNINVDRNLHKFVLFAKYLFYFLIAEEILITTINILYKKSYSGQLILIAFYLFLITYFFIYSYFRPLKCFQSKFLCYLNILKKVLYPIIICFNFQFKYILPIIMLCFLAIQFFYQWKIQKLRNKQILRIKMIQSIFVVSFVVYEIIEIKSNSYVGVLIFSIVLTLILIGYLSIAYYDIVIKLQFKYKQYKQKQQSKIQNFNATIQQLGKEIPNNRIITQLEMHIEPTSQLNIQKKSELIQKQQDEKNERKQKSKLQKKQIKQLTINLNQIVDHQAQDTKNGLNAIEVYSFGDEEIQSDVSKKNQQDKKTIKIENDKDQMLAMMNLTQKSPKRRKMMKDIDKMKELKITYGIK